MELNTEHVIQTAKAQFSLPRISARNASFATILVGPDHVRFVVHESLVVHYSKFFRAALTGNFSESKDKTVKLEEDDPKNFELFVHWLYYQRFPKKTLGDDNDLLELWANDTCLSMDNCIYLHVFGDKYEIEKLRQDTINEMVQIVLGVEENCLPGPEATQIAFDCLPPNSPLCRLIIDLHCFEGDPASNSILDRFKCIPFLQGLWRRYGEYTINVEVKYDDLRPAINLCDYHEHSDEKEKKACKKGQKKAE